MKRYLLLLLLCTINPCHAQLINSFGGGCIYTEHSVYIVNDNSVIYQDCKSRKVLHPDRATFRQPRYNEIGVAMDKNGLYFQGTLLPIDTTGFTVVGRDNNYSDYHWLWKTKDKVYCNLDEVSGVDAATFASIECLNGTYFKDKKSVYYFDKTITKIEGSDGPSVNKTCSGWVYDKNFVYVQGKPLTYNGETVKPVNQVLAKTSSAVINVQLQPVPGMDPATIKGLSANYSRDKNHIYWYTEKTPIKPANFKNAKVWEQGNRAYVTDGIIVYAGASMAEKEFDAKTFGMLPHSDVCFDKNGVYERKWVESTQKVINEKFKFQYTSPVSAANLFITDDSRYIIYKDQAYDPLDGKIYKKLTAEQIGWMKEGKLELNSGNGPKTPKHKIDEWFYVQDNIVTMRLAGTVHQFKAIDTKSFQPINFPYVKDKDHVYRLLPDLKIIPVDAATAKPFYGYFIRDKDNIYFDGKPVLSSKGAEVLAAYAGYRQGCSLDEHPQSDYYFVRNEDGYYLIETTSPEPAIKFLGKTFNDEWDPRFRGFDLGQ